MPEGHKTHHLAFHTLQPLVGEKLRVTSPQGRFRAGARKLSGRRLESIEAAGKHLFFDFEGDRLLHIHLGRYGKFRELELPPPEPRGKVRVRLLGDSAAFDLNGPTTCRVITANQREEIVRKLGPDPLGGGRKGEAKANVASSRKPIGALLLDQSVISGVGNIFRAEVLFETRIDPQVPGKELSSNGFDAIWRSLGKMMRTGLKYGKIISVSSREAGKRLADLEGKERFRIYTKSRCPRCEGDIATPKIGGRKLYVCPLCQTER